MNSWTCRPVHQYLNHKYSLFADVFTGRINSWILTMLTYQMCQRWEYFPHKPVGEKRNAIESSHRRRRGQTWISSDGAGPVLLSSCEPDLWRIIGLRGGGGTFPNPSPVGFATSRIRAGARKNKHFSWGCITRFNKYMCVTSHVNKRRKQHVFQCLFLSAAVWFVFRDPLVDDFWPCSSFQT